MHAQYAFARVPHVARNTACCVIDEFIPGVRRLLVTMHIQLCADFAPLPLVGLLISKCTMSRSRESTL